jgi:hypothetical protein
MEQNYRYAEGLTSCGYTEQTIAIVRGLQGQKGKSNRDALRAWLSSLEEPITYSNEDLDLRQGFAACLSNIAREYKFRA